MKVCVWTCSLIFYFLLAIHANATGKVIINPVIYSGIENNSNFWKSATSEVSVNSYFVKPGIILGYKTPKLDVFFDGTIDAYWYKDRDQPQSETRVAEDDNYVGTTIDTSANYQISDRLNLGVSDFLLVTRDPARSDKNSNSIARDKYTINYFEPNVYYDLADKFSLMTQYRNTSTNYEKNLEDSDEHRGIFDLFYNLNSRAAVYLDYQLWKRSYDKTSANYTSNQIAIKYKHQLNFFSIDGGGGYHHRSFDSSDLNSMDLFSWQLQVEGIDPDLDKRMTRNYLSVNIGQEMNDDGTGDNYFTATYIRLEGAHKFFDKIGVGATFAFQNSAYNTDNRDEDTYRVSGRLGYKVLELFTFGLEYGIETRSSNLDGYDYNDTFVMFTLDADYIIGSNSRVIR